MLILSKILESRSGCIELRLLKESRSFKVERLFKLNLLASSISKCHHSRNIRTVKYIEIEMRWELHLLNKLQQHRLPKLQHRGGSQARCNHRFQAWQLCSLSFLNHLSSVKLLQLRSSSVKSFNPGRANVPSLGNRGPNWTFRSCLRDFSSLSYNAGQLLIKVRFKPSS
jgi:hypothetical protein